MPGDTGRLGESRAAGLPEQPERLKAYATMKLAEIDSFSPLIPFLPIVLMLIMLAAWLLCCCAKHNSQLGKAVVLAIVITLCVQAFLQYRMEFGVHVI